MSLTVQRVHRNALKSINHSDLKISDSNSNVPQELYDLFVYDFRTIIPENTRTEHSTCTYQFFVYG